MQQRQQQHTPQFAHVLVMIRLLLTSLTQVLMTATHTCYQRSRWLSTPNLVKHHAKSRFRGEGLSWPPHSMHTPLDTPCHATVNYKHAIFWAMLPGCRKRRQYACQDINALLSKAGLNTALLADRWAELEVCDDASYESRTAEEWVPSTAGRHLRMDRLCQDQRRHAYVVMLKTPCFMQPRKHPLPGAACLPAYRPAKTDSPGGCPEHRRQPRLGEMHCPQRRQ